MTTDPVDAWGGPETVDVGAPPPPLAQAVDVREWAEIEADRLAERRLVRLAAVALLVVVVLVLLGRVVLT